MNIGFHCGIPFTELCKRTERVTHSPVAVDTDYYIILLKNKTHLVPRLKLDYETHLK